MVAVGFWENSVNVTGWNKLDIDGTFQAEPSVIYRGAGMIEGYATAEGIYQLYPSFPTTPQL